MNQTQAELVVKWYLELEDRLAQILRVIAQFIKDSKKRSILNSLYMIHIAP